MRKFLLTIALVLFLLTIALKIDDDGQLCRYTRVLQNRLNTYHPQKDLVVNAVHHG